MIEEAEHQRREVERLLHEHWGHSSFRAGQWPAVRAALAGEDVLAILPTGGGKSICYQLPGLLGEGLTLVVSPLIALMQDQVAGLQARGMSAAFINSTLSRREIEQRWTDAEFGRYRFLYLAPERLKTERFQARAERLDVSFLAIDEAHCVSEWGHHFRPAYLDIPEARRRLGSPPTIAVTATATPEVRRDITEHLALRGPRQVIKGFDRPNLVWSIFRTENKRAKVLDVVENVPGSGLLYAATRRAVERWTRQLREAGETAAAYHAGLPSEKREAVQTAWLEGEVRMVVATNAFGMGIDKPDVRFVVHVDMPGSLEAYYQEAGRAGRDGEQAYAVLLFHQEDEQTQHALIEGSHPDAGAVRAVYEAACSLAQLPIGAEPEGPVALDLEAIARVTGFGMSRVNVAIDLIERQGTWQTLPVQKHHGLLRFRMSVGQMRRYAGEQANQSLADFLRTLVRTVHADAFSEWWEMDLRILERRSGLERRRLMKGLDFLKNHNVLDWRPPGSSTRVWFAEPRTKHLPVEDRSVRRARRRSEKKLDMMLRYARSVTCRRHFLLSYFGEKSSEQCGTCDICMGRHQAVVITPEDEPVLRHILKQVEQEAPREEWFEDSSVSAKRPDSLVDWLVQEGYLEVEAPFEERFALTDKARSLMEQWKPRSRAER